MALNESILLSILKNPKPAPQNHFAADCPFCSKTGHFFINRGIKVKNGKTLHNPFICHKCKESGTINKLLIHLNKEYLIEGEKVDRIKTPMLGVSIEAESDKFYEEAIDYKMPIGFKLLDYYDDDNEFVKYLKKRKFTEFDFELYKPGYTNLKKKLDKYVLIQITKDFVTKGCLARYILEEGNEGYDENQPRYRNSTSKFSKLLMGYDELTSKTESLILVEGGFDKVSVTTELGLHDVDDIKCVCSFGNKISDDQILLLKKIRSLKNLFLMYDTRDSVELIKKYGLILQNHWNVMVCSINNQKDAGEANNKEITDSIINSQNIFEYKYTSVQKRK